MQQDGFTDIDLDDQDNDGREDEFDTQIEGIHTLGQFKHGLNSLTDSASAIIGFYGDTIISPVRKGTDLALEFAAHEERYRNSKQPPDDPAETYSGGDPDGEYPDTSYYSRQDTDYPDRDENPATPAGHTPGDQHPPATPPATPPPPQTPPEDNGNDGDDSSSLGDFDDSGTPDYEDRGEHNNNQDQGGGDDNDNGNDNNNDQGGSDHGGGTSSNNPADNQASRDQNDRGGRDGDSGNGGGGRGGGGGGGHNPGDQHGRDSTRGGNDRGGRDRDGGGNDGGGNGGNGGGGNGDGPGGGYGPGDGGRPVLIDLDGDGEITLISAEESTVLFDYDGDGYARRTAWVGGNDGLLAYDKDENGIIRDHDELSFVGYVDDAETDLEGLKFFDTNNNGRLDAGDNDWGKFRIWQDANQNGITDEGELRTLTQMGITGLGLTATGTARQVLGSTIHGETTFTKSDGSTLKGFDVTFSLLGDALRIIAYNDALALRIKDAEGAIIELLAYTNNVDHTLSLDDDSETRAVLGGEGADTFTMTGDDDVIFMGGGGNDALSGGGGNDILFGGAGDDTLTGNAGNDILIGGGGGDTLKGGAGDDIYIYQRGDGAVTIHDLAQDESGQNINGGVDTLIFGQGIHLADLRIETRGTDIVITLLDPDTRAVTSDVITIKNGAETFNAIENRNFADDTDLASSIEISGVMEAWEDSVWNDPAGYLLNADHRDGKVRLTVNQVAITGDATSVAGTYGTFTIDQNGFWAYTLDNSNAAVEALDGDDDDTDGGLSQLTETVTVAYTNASGQSETRTFNIIIHGRTDIYFEDNGETTATGNYRYLINGEPFTSFYLSSALRNEDVTIHGQNVDTIFNAFTLHGKDVIHGNDGNNRIYSRNDFDIIHGYGGDDLLGSTGGSDIINGGEGSDTSLYLNRFISDIEVDLGSAIRWKYNRASGEWESGTGPEYEYIRATYLHVYDDPDSDGHILVREYDYLSSIENIRASNNGREAGVISQNRIFGDEGRNIIDIRNGETLADGRGGDDIILTGSNEDILIGGKGHDFLFGGRDADIFVLYQGEHAEGETNLDIVADFSSEDKIRVDTENGDETTLSALRDAAEIRWVKAHVETGEASNDNTVLDTAIYATQGTTATADDILLMVLEDFTQDLTLNQFEVI